ncbi:hypothetical protein [Pseudooceanicola sp.]|uniref:hypothetical protein n=1 Tax=Pseudooceanicola sp. TaxID=1914328 RepID=UPI00263969B5|nr:hypothetical protein [Pseudooceanicola sp.]MDF1856087.1 hypothetical protein [Pseudooceanicola sp.]
MLELLIVFALASIGIYFTTTTNEPEYSGASRYDMDEFETSEDEDEGAGIGILGFDLARKNKKRSKKALQDAADDLPLAAVVEDDFDREGDGISGMDDHLATMAEATDASVGDTIRSVIGGFDVDADYSSAGAGDLDEDDTPEIAERRAFHGASDLRDWDSADEDDELFEDDVDLDLISSMARGDLLEVEGAPEAKPAAKIADAIGGMVRGGAPDIGLARRDEDEDDDFDTGFASGKAHRANPAAPLLIEDFDPEADQIMIAYNREETGDGRIGISEDPANPGTARVTLGGKVVAIVPGGYGLVRAHHIDLYPAHQAA